MMHGLTFIAVASQSNGDRWERRQRAERLDRHQRLVLAEGGELTDDERKLLQELANQLEAGELPVSPRGCPECDQPMALVTVCGMELDCCATCRGMWFDPGELQALSRQAKEIPSDDKVHRRSRFRCPDCGGWMTEFTFLNPHSLTVDRCPHGHGVYLEERELERIFELA